MDNLILILYNVVLSLWVGGIAILSFLITPVIFKSFTRIKAGTIVGYIFPRYFVYNLVLAVLAFFLLMFLYKSSVKFAYYLSVLLAATAVCINVIHLKVIHPAAKHIKSDIQKLRTPLVCDTLKLKRLTVAFKKIHRTSIILNLVVFTEGVMLLILYTFITRSGAGS
ncbi:MAG: DUF4149 domain-containing protein [Candidatus Magnetoovum sp. WYHC-5]|nr:DUF4149 domain-containing protein [Candidatus Magnetoovum sp. WYHC-5]